MTAVRELRPVPRRHNESMPDESIQGRVEIDPELRAALAVIGGVFPPTITPDLIGFMRASYASPPREELLRDRRVQVEDLTFPGFDGYVLAASVIRPVTGLRGPAVLLFHSGGMMFGDRFSGIDTALGWVERLGVTVVTVEYRLAPEHRHPVPFEDCYAALEWVAHSSKELGLDSRRLVVAGASAGGGLAAEAALAARDRGGPPLLGESARGPDVSPYAAPARATDLRDLPPAFIDVGTAEIFRDEAVGYARGLWAAGVDAELHVWPGAFHACDIFAPHTRIARRMIVTREDWLRRTLAD